jgi:hypothetical protein
VPAVAEPLSKSIAGAREGATRATTLLIFNDAFSGKTVDVTWEVHADSATGAVASSGTFSVDVPLASMATKSITLTAPASGAKCYLVLRPQKDGATLFQETDEVFNLQ